MFTQAIARRPGRSLVNGITSAGLGTPDYDLACRQHRAYCDALAACGLKVTVLPALEDYPDAVFIEDAALCTSAGAVLTRPGAPTRRGESALLEPDLESRFECIERIAAPGTLDAGDVMMAGRHFYIGRSARSNEAGVAQLSAILESHGFHATPVPLQSVLHLKTGIAYLEHDTVLVAGEFVSASAFAHFNRIEVPPGESYAANSVWVNDRVLMPAGHPRTQAQVRALGYEVLEIDVSEFRKLDGGLSCLSLRF